MVYWFYLGSRVRPNVMQAGHYKEHGKLHLGTIHVDARSKAGRQVPACLPDGTNKSLLASPIRTYLGSSVLTNRNINPCFPVSGTPPFGYGRQDPPSQAENVP